MKIAETRIKGIIVRRGLTDGNLEVRVSEYTGADKKPIPLSPPRSKVVVLKENLLAESLREGQEIVIGGTDIGVGKEFRAQRIQVLNTTNTRWHPNFMRTCQRSLAHPSLDSTQFSQIQAKRFLVLYFSAHWCNPCRVTTPKLIKLYEEADLFRNFELVFVSFDKSQAEMGQYIEEAKMPWFYTQYGSLGEVELKKAFPYRGIPCMIVLDERDNKILCSYDEQNKYITPDVILSQMKDIFTQPGKQLNI